MGNYTYGIIIAIIVAFLSLTINLIFKWIDSKNPSGGLNSILLGIKSDIKTIANQLLELERKILNEYTKNTTFEKLDEKVDRIDKDIVKFSVDNNLLREQIKEMMRNVEKRKR